MIVSLIGLLLLWAVFTWMMEVAGRDKIPEEDLPRLRLPFPVDKDGTQIRAKVRAPVRIVKVRHPGTRTY